MDRVSARDEKTTKNGSMPQNSVETFGLGLPGLPVSPNQRIFSPFHLIPDSNQGLC
jgi:hypothetical protein